MKRIFLVCLLGLPFVGFGVVVKRGDTLWHLCKKHLGDPFLWPKIGEYNKLKNPHLIFPKQIIEFPGKDEIKKGIEFEDGEVMDVSGYAGVAKKRLEAGDKIRTNETLRTQPNSRIEILFPCGDLISVMDETSIKFEGRDRETSALSIGLIQGKIKVAPGKKIRVITIDGFVDISSGEVFIDRGNLTRISVFEGEAYVSAYGKRIFVSAGYGTIITEKGPIDPVKLPEPPKVLLPLQTSITGNMRSVIKWEGDAGRYLVEITKDIAFIHPEFNVLSRELEVISEPLREGNYYLRISGIDNNGLQGKPSDITRFAIERRVGLKYEIVPLFSNLPTRLYTQDNKNYISSNSLIYLLPVDEDNSISKVLVRIDSSPYISYKEPIRLKEGNRVLSYKAIDMLQEEDKEEIVSFIVDGNLPFGELKTSYPIKDGYLTQDATCTITGSDTTSGLSRIQVMVNDETKEYLNKAEFDLSIEGYYKIIHRFEDNVGNISNENSLSFILDKNPPLVSFFTDPKMATYNKNCFLPEENKIIFQASDSPAGVLKILYSVDSENLSPYQEAFTIKEEGLHIIRYKAIDKAGNESQISSFSVWIEPLMYEKYK
ncbi:MAG: LysM peptidoglycan-binding domain-containing protein [bacterium]